jgi:hypothetical protein
VRPDAFGQLAEIRPLWSLAMRIGLEPTSRQSAHFGLAQHCPARNASVKINAQFK